MRGKQSCGIWRALTAPPLQSSTKVHSFRDRLAKTRQMLARLPACGVVFRPFSLSRRSETKPDRVRRYTPSGIVLPKLASCSQYCLPAIVCVAAGLSSAASGVGGCRCTPHTPGFVTLRRGKRAIRLMAAFVGSIGKVWEVLGVFGCSAANWCDSVRGG